ncbi:uncharacterized protein LOC110031723 [Phalaenopsis equestris]|uniref:uncharacterized protein LOC110031723 n=1 Tax=Phalaenopsis equestris TaxID=78828 RepID=UPI0009E1D551|nr:uncharacterized protein LOC110031723 [Phalaenopsis equestris]
MADAAELLSPGILIDIVDDEWTRETLPKDDVPLPSGMAPRIDDAGDSTGIMGNLRKFLYQKRACHPLNIHSSGPTLWHQLLV